MLFWLLSSVPLTTLSTTLSLPNPFTIPLSPSLLPSTLLTHPSFLYYPLSILSPSLPLTHPPLLCDPQDPPSRSRAAFPGRSADSACYTGVCVCCPCASYVCCLCVCCPCTVCLLSVYLLCVLCVCAVCVSFVRVLCVCCLCVSVLFLKHDYSLHHSISLASQTNHRDPQPAEREYVQRVSNLRYVQLQDLVIY